MPKKPSNEKLVEVVPLKLEKTKLKIVGTTPLLMEKMDLSVVEKYNKKKGQKITKEDTRLEEEKLDDKVHRDENGNVAFPASGFSKGLAGVAGYLGLYKKDVLGSIRVLGNLIPIKFKKQSINQTWGRQSGINKSPRKILRPEFQEWSCVVEVVYNANVISLEQLVNLFNWSGFQFGLGSWRPEKGGSFGQYRVEN